MINSSLRYVFFANGRLEVHSEDECYKLYSNGSLLNPTHVMAHIQEHSDAESNINSWCEDIKALNL